MSTVTNNPCLACPTNQHCCSRLSGLLLSEDEFRRHFAGHRDGLSVRRSGKVVSVSAKSGGPCPHWGNDGCRIYRERPIDCRVFPYIPYRIIDRGERIKIVFHTRSDCPQKESLFLQMPEAEVKALLLAFGRQLYGETRTIVVQQETGIFSRIRTRIEAAIFRRLHRNRQT
ncbi:MAG TPA: YkgJ family cysteine cluster protein [Geobacteraceae bacterium]|nr:YkgJ family cysteine cluster protein [Geobacteraceae bacterium]